MHRRAIAVAVVSLVATTALAGPASAAQAGQTDPVESCTVVTESGTYQLGDGLANVSTADVENATVGNVTGANVTDGNATAANATGDALAGANASNASATAANASNRFTVGDQTALGCLVVRADDVVLEGDGLEVTGPVGPNVTAENATAADRPTLVGVAVLPGTANDTVENVSIRNLSVAGFDVGVYVRDSRNVTFGNLSAVGNARGAIRFVNGSAAAGDAAGAAVDDETTAAEAGA